ncbi:hypothetical protein BXZ70DRAFT_44081 [Cristinia sonorae]|uniref:Uncharacterized protein n=1 Tax=Cristinia sonorae TaxID=1940300 RepID=A0A8K0V0W2_9AGAR|nr:hypothetical protein BXZ70DRAFT_44081 [Cristinia sonorae]
MSHLPPKPDFQVDFTPSRSPPRRPPMSHPHPSSRRSPPPRDRDKDRDRDRYRSPPRSSRGPPPPPRGLDTYIGRGGRDREPDRHREPYRRREYDRRDRDREYVPPPQPEPRYRREDNWEPGERRDEPRPDEPRSRREEDDRRAYRREPARPVGDTRPWPRPGGRYGRDNDRGRYDRDIELERRRRPSRSPHRFDRSPLSRARSPLPSIRRRSASPPPRRGRTRTRTPSPARPFARNVPDSTATSHRASNNDRGTPGSSRKRSRERRSRSRSTSPLDRKRVAQSPSPVRRTEGASQPPASTSANDQARRSLSPFPTDSPPRLSPSTVSVPSVRQEAPAELKIETQMDVDPPEVTSTPGARSHPEPSANKPDVSRHRSPPHGPRHYIKTPTTPQSPRPSPTVPPHGQTTVEVNAPPTGPAAHRIPITPLEKPRHNFPPINWRLPKDGSKPTLYKMNPTQTQDTEYARLRGARTAFIKEYSTIHREQQRILHELTLATFDLDLADKRRSITTAQLDKARVGALGIDYVHPEKDDSEETRKES